MNHKWGTQPHSSCLKGCGCKGCMKNKLNTFDYLSGLPPHLNVEDYVEVQFKNTRKGYYLNSLRIPLSKGDLVAVEASPGHDIGMVTLTGKLVELQMRRVKYRHPNGQPRRIYRIAKPVDLEKYEEVKALEDETMILSREIAKDLNLDMKIGDVEYQGDGQKAIFYYIADNRVDFRQLIKRLSEQFRIRVEMKQIGSRQEAGRIGGIGPCGRPLCCSSWMRGFVSVSTNAARIQDLSMNPQKLAGQCAKLKCCLNYEVDTYYEAQKKLPSSEIHLHTYSGVYRQCKVDALAGELTYVNVDRNATQEFVTISAQRAFEIIEMNRDNIRPHSLRLDKEPEKKTDNSKDILDQDALTRFDRQTPRKNNKRGKGKKKPETSNSTVTATTAEHTPNRGMTEPKNPLGRRIPKRDSRNPSRTNSHERKKRGNSTSPQSNSKGE